MQKIILDTNVIISALISNSIPTKILFELVLTERVQIVLSEDIYIEYVEVLSRDKFVKFKNFKANADFVLNKLREISKYYKTDKKIDLLSDVSDNKFLELASASSADYLVTGNSNDFTISEFEYTSIVSPRTFWEHYNSL
jgi:putative PIN family toxin of toxin-antitoxin system